MVVARADVLAWTTVMTQTVDTRPTYESLVAQTLLCVLTAETGKRRSEVFHCLSPSVSVLLAADC